jgi:hypothetical protein
MVIAYGYDNDNECLLIKYPLNTYLGLDGFFWLPYHIVLDSNICNEFTIITKKKLIKKLKYSHNNLMQLVDSDKIEQLMFSNFKFDNSLLFDIKERFNNYNSSNITITYESNKKNISTSESTDSLINNIEVKSGSHYSISTGSKDLDCNEIKINI